MKAYFHSTSREDTMTPMWLDQDRISTWLAARNREEKDRRKAASKAVNSSGAGAGFALGSASKKAPPAEAIEESDDGSSSADSDSFD